MQPTTGWVRVGRSYRAVLDIADRPPDGYHAQLWSCLYDSHRPWENLLVLTYMSHLAPPRTINKIYFPQDGESRVDMIAVGKLLEGHAFEPAEQPVGWAHYWNENDYNDAVLFASIQQVEGTPVWLSWLPKEWS